MSNYLAIATVTATLQRVLQGFIGPDVPNATATMVRPDAAGQGLPPVGVNIFLYQVTPNAALRNADLPTRNSTGQAGQRPVAALDLHYLLSFYGADGTLQPQRVLGSVVRSLHSQPLFTRQMIRDTINDPHYQPYLANSNLADSVDLVRFSPLSFTLEEFSKLWSVMLQTPYALSVAYSASVVLIEDDIPTLSPKPVRDRQVFVRPFQSPFIDNLDPQILATGAAGAKLTINGQNLRGDVTKLKFGDTLAVPTTIGDRQITVTLPATLQPGVRTLQVIHDFDFGTAKEPHRGLESNAVPFILQPKIAIGNVTHTVVTVKFVPKVGKTQRVQLVLNELNAPTTRPEHDYTIDPPEDNGITVVGQIDTDTIVFLINAINPPINAVLAGDYLVRVRVDGAESSPDVDTNENSPTFGQYLGTPKITIP